MKKYMTVHEAHEWLKERDYICRYEMNSRFYTDRYGVPRDIRYKYRRYIFIEVWRVEDILDRCSYQGLMIVRATSDGRRIYEYIRG